jgi:predicted helicase
MRKHFLQDFERIDHIDLHGNVRRNPKLSGTTHNVFGIQVGVGITLAVKKKGTARQLRYHRVPEMWRKAEKLAFLAQGDVPWQTLTPDVEHTWLVLEHTDEYRAFAALDEMFAIHTRGLETTRDSVVYDFDRDTLAARVKKFVVDYNSEVSRHKHDDSADFPDHIKWSSRLKECLARGQEAEFAETKIRLSLYRPFAKRWVFFDAVLNQRTGQWPNISGRAIVISDIAWRAPVFSALMTDSIADLHACAAIDAHQCFPLSHLKDEAVAQFRRRYSDDSLTREQVFHYLYALLHHPDYRERYAANLKRELPRIPFAPDFAAFATAGQELARLHVEYESASPWPLQEIETKGVPYSERVEKMKLSPDRESLQINPSLTLSGIPAEAFDYRLGSRSALEWVIDQYQVKGESDPNREDDPGYILRLVGQVIRVSLETVRLVKTLPHYR